MSLERYRSFIMDNARWNSFELRPGDIVISTPPKCGTTWTQMMCALLIFQDPVLPRPLTELSPWFEMQTNSHDEVVALLEAQEHRRFIKSHTPLDGLPYDDQVTYLCVARDPRDVALSWDNHMANIDFEAMLHALSKVIGPEGLAQMGEIPVPAEDPIERYRRWVDNDDPRPVTLSTLVSTLHHLETFWEVRDRPNVALFHYDDLRADLEGEMRRLADVLDITVAPERWPELIEAASFAAMKERADDLAPDVNNRIWRDNGRFFNRGTTGQWEGLLSEDDLRHYEERVAKLVDEDLAAWVHNGWGGVPGATIPLSKA